MKNIFSSEFLDKDDEQLNKDLENYRKTLKKLKKLAAENDDILIKRKLFSCLTDMGLAFEKLEQNNEAIKCYEKAYEVVREYATPDGVLEDRYDLAIALFNYGKVAGAWKNLDLSRKKLTESMNLFRPIASELDNTSTWRILSIILYYLGATLMESGRLEEALERTDEAVEISKKLFTKTPAYDVSYCLGQCMRQKGQILEEQKQLDKALLTYKESAEILRKLLKENDYFLSRQIFGEILDKIITVYILKNQFDEALKYCVEAIKVFRSLTNNTNNRIDIIESITLSRILNRYGEILFRVGKLKESLEAFEEGLSILNRLPRNKVKEADCIYWYKIYHELLTRNKRFTTRMLKPHNRS